MKVLQLIDTLNTGGAERMAVNYANMLAKANGESYLVTTRQSGVLKNVLNDKVIYKNLDKERTFDWSAIKALKNFVKHNDISIVHAHTTSYFFAVLTKFFMPSLKIVWHDHHGNRVKASIFKKLPIKLSSILFSGVICVNEELLLWAKKNLFTKNIIYLQNFLSEQNKTLEKTILFGEEGKRIVKVANLRHPKNHLMLLQAFNNISNMHDDWSLHLVGSDKMDDYSIKLKNFIKENHLQDKVYIYGVKNDVSNILHQCEIGVIASTSEGLPMALLEYGNAALSVITTNVGKCGNIVENRGVVINEVTSIQIEKALLSLIEDEQLRISSSNKIKDYIDSSFSETVILKEVEYFYQSL